jgi:CRP-like cAMP-binding protein
MAVRDLDFAALRDLRGRYGAIFPRGRVVFHEGETTTDFYVVLQGSVDLVSRDPVTGAGRVIRTVSSGEFFGEMSCFCERARSATAVARDEAVLLCLGQAAINDLLARSPRFARGVIQTLCDRILADTDDVARARQQLGDAPR